MPKNVKPVFTTSVPTAFRKPLKLIAVHREMSLIDLIAEIMTGYLKSQKAKRPRNRR